MFRHHNADAVCTSGLSIPLPLTPLGSPCHLLRSKTACLATLGIVKSKT